MGLKLVDKGRVSMGKKKKGGEYRGGLRVVVKDGKENNNLRNEKGEPSGNKE